MIEQKRGMLESEVCMQEHTRNKKLIGSMLLLALLGALLMTKGKEERNHTPTPELPFVLSYITCPIVHIEPHTKKDNI